MNKKLFLMLLTLLVSMRSFGMPISEEAMAYAVFLDNKLTFYYDRGIDRREGTSYELNTGDVLPGWYSDGNYKNVEEVVFHSGSTAWQS